MSPVKVILDGQSVHRQSGTMTAGSGKVIPVGYATIETAGAVLQDDEVAEFLLDLVKAGEGPAGLVYVEDEESAAQVSVPATPEAPAPQNDQDLNPAHNEGREEEQAKQMAEGGESYSDDPDFEPDKHNQPQVLEYLGGASPAEVDRVKQLEAGGQNRQQIAAFESAEDQ